MAMQSNSWSLALRYHAQAERHYRRAIEEFKRLKALRPETAERTRPGGPTRTKGRHLPLIGAEPISPQSPASERLPRRWVNDNPP